MSGDRRRVLQRVEDARWRLNRAQSEYVLALYAARQAGASYAEIGVAAVRSPSTIRARLDG